MKHLVSYQHEVDKGKLTAVASFEMVTFRARALRRSKVEDYGLYVCLYIYIYIYIYPYPSISIYIQFCIHPRGVKKPFHKYQWWRIGSQRA